MCATRTPMGYSFIEEASDSEEELSKKRSKAKKGGTRKRGGTSLIKKTNKKRSTKKGARPIAQEDLNTPPMTLTPEQEAVVQNVITGHNVFIGGPAGTGKSLVIRSLIEKLYKLGKSVYVTASTGTAAINLDIGCASTLHSFLSFGKCEESPEKILEGYKKQGLLCKGANNIRDADVLIIDEISMVSPELFDKTDYLAKNLRGSDAFFGGIQVIMSGDFHQLPPVIKNTSKTTTKSTALCKVQPTFVFESPLWQEGAIRVHILEKIFRQEEDPEFANLLNSLRDGELSDHHIKTLRSRLGVELKPPNGIQPTVLFPKLFQVQTENARRLRLIPGDGVFYKSSSCFSGISDSKGKTILAQMMKNLPMEPELELKVGCAVVLTVNLNLNKKLSNGSQGIVEAFTEGDSPLPIVKFSTGISLTIQQFAWTYDVANEHGALLDADDEEFIGVRVLQIPLKVAFALSIHKSQGLTLEYVKLSLGKEVFARGAAYVGLSRCKRLSGLSLTDFDVSAIMFDPRVIEFYASHKKPTQSESNDIGETTHTISERPYEEDSDIVDCADMYSD